MHVGSIFSLDWPKFFHSKLNLALVASLSFLLEFLYKKGGVGFDCKEQSKALRVTIMLFMT